MGPAVHHLVHRDPTVRRQARRRLVQSPGRGEAGTDHVGGDPAAGVFLGEGLGEARETRSDRIGEGEPLHRHAHGDRADHRHPPPAAPRHRRDEVATGDCRGEELAAKCLLPGSTVKPGDGTGGRTAARGHHDVVLLLGERVEGGLTRRRVGEVEGAPGGGPAARLLYPLRRLLQAGGIARDEAHLRPLARQGDGAGVAEATGGGETEGTASGEIEVHMGAPGEWVAFSFQQSSIPSRWTVILALYGLRGETAQGIGCGPNAETRRLRSGDEG